MIIIAMMIAVINMTCSSMTRTDCAGNSEPMAFDVNLANANVGHFHPPLAPLGVGVGGR